MRPLKECFGRKRRRAPDAPDDTALTTEFRPCSATGLGTVCVSLEVNDLEGCIRVAGYLARRASITALSPLSTYITAPSAAQPGQSAVVTRG